MNETQKEVNYDLMSVTELARSLRDLRKELDDAAAAKTDLQKKYDYLSIEVIPDKMSEEDIRSMNIDGVGRLESSSDIRCSVPAANKEAMQQWLIEHGHKSMMSPTINASTLKAFVKEMIKNNGEWPEDLLKVHHYSRAKIVKS